MAQLDALYIDLSDLDIADVEVLAQEGGRGIPEFAASCGTYCCAPNACSCTTTKEPSAALPAEV